MRRAIQWGLRLGIGGVFLYAGAVKILDPAGFLVDIESFRLLPHLAAVALALYLPWLELLAGGALWLRKGYSGAVAVLLVLTVVFGVAIASAWARGLDISCGCFGVTGDVEANYPWLLGRDILLFLGLAVLALLGRAGTESDRSAGAP